MTTGTVKFYNSTRGYGFIEPEDGGKDVFVHATALERAGMRGLVEGQKVSFDIETDRRTGKTTATNIREA
jgi:cold shock protein